tara:strand:+ start:221 stop:1630 length:1410 start_codon:yes stop_codon:yes gene_type:complete
MIKCGYLLLIAFLIAWAATAENITTGNLLPNGSGNASNYQSVDSSIPNVTTNGFTVEGNIRDWGQELETTGTGSINYTGTLLDIVTNDDTTTQDKLDNGITLNSTTIVQNCEWVGSAYQCGQARAGQDTYTTTVQILDKDGTVLATVNQTRNNDSGYGANAYKYEDTVTYAGAGSNQFYWEWEGVDEGSYVNLGGPNLLGAKLTMTYNNIVIPEETIEEIYEVIEEFEEWEEQFVEEELIEEFELLPPPIALEEMGIIIEEEQIVEVFETFEELEEEFEEVEILQVFGGPEIVPEPEEEEVSNETTVAAVEEEFMEEQPEPTESTPVETVQEEPQSEPSNNEQVAVAEEESTEVSVSVSSIQAEVSVKIKSVEKQLAATSIIAQQVMVQEQVDLSSYNKAYVDNRKIYEGNTYEDLRTLDEYAKKIYNDDRKFVAISMNDPVKDYQNNLRNATIKRKIAEQELRQLRGY